MATAASAEAARPPGRHLTNIIHVESKWKGQVCIGWQPCDSPTGCGKIERQTDRARGILRSIEGERKEGWKYGWTDCQEEEDAQTAILSLSLLQLMLGKMDG